MRLMEFFKEVTNGQSGQVMENTEQVHQQRILIETPLDTLVHPVAGIGNTLIRC